MIGTTMEKVPNNAQDFKAPETDGGEQEEITLSNKSTEEAIGQLDALDFETEIKKNEGKLNVQDAINDVTKELEIDPTGKSKFEIANEIQEKSATKGGVH